MRVAKGKSGKGLSQTVAMPPEVCLYLIERAALKLQGAYFTSEYFEEDDRITFTMERCYRGKPIVTVRGLLTRIGENTQISAQLNWGNLRWILPASFTWGSGYGFFVLWVALVNQFPRFFADVIDNWGTEGLMQILLQVAPLLLFVVGSALIVGGLLSVANMVDTHRAWLKNLLSARHLTQPTQISNDIWKPQIAVEFTSSARLNYCPYLLLHYAGGASEWSGINTIFVQLYPNRHSEERATLQTLPDGNTHVKVERMDYRPHWRRFLSSRGGDSLLLVIAAWSGIDLFQKIQAGASSREVGEVIGLLVVILLLWLIFWLPRRQNAPRTFFETILD